MKIKSFLSAICYLLFAIPAYAQSPFPSCNPAKFDPEFCPAGLDQIAGTFQRFISISVGLAFVALLVMVIFAGYKYLASGGEPKAVSSAHQTLTWALLGIFFLAIAWLILLLIHALTGVDVTIFNIKALCGDQTALPFCQPNKP